MWVGQVWNQDFRPNCMPAPFHSSFIYYLLRFLESLWLHYFSCEKLLHLNHHYLLYVGWSTNDSPLWPWFNELEYPFTWYKDGKSSVVALTVVWLYTHLQASSFHTSHAIETASEKTFPTSPTRVRTYFVSDEFWPPLLHLQPFLSGLVYHKLISTWPQYYWLESVHSALDSPITH